MSNFKSVLDFLQSASKAANHEDVYERILAKASKGEIGELDLNKLEEACIGIGEKNILRDLDMMDKFIYKGMDEKFVLASSSLAKQREKGRGKGSLKGDREYEETFLMEESLVVKPSMQWVVESGRKGTQIPSNSALYRSLLAQITGLIVRDMTGANLSFIGEMLTARQDMRYMFLKGYLSVMAYNLAVTGGVVDGQSKALTINALSCIEPDMKVAALLQYNVVVDVAHFTNEEKWFLAEMSNSYPTRRYGKANVYNNLMLDADDVVFISDGVTFSKKESAPAYGSPERMWTMLISIATKMDALDDLFSVVRDFRGLPFLMRTLYDMTDKDEYIVNYPKSRNIVSAVEDALERRPTVNRFSGFFSTSKCLISDLLLGRMMEMSVFNVLEEVGAFGDFGVPMKDPMSDKFFGSNLKNMGLRSDNEEDNSILQEWRGVRGCSMVVGLAGKVYKLATMMANKVRRKEVDFLRPQLLYSLPFSAFKNTTWATIRGWMYNEFKFNDTNAQRLMMSRKTRAYCWVMGVTKEVPSIGLNALGLTQCDNLKHAELEFLRMGSGQYDITLVRHGLTIDVLPRTDEYELISNVFYKSSFPGTRCSIIYDAGGNSSLVIENKVDLFAVETVPEDRDIEEKFVKSRVPSQMTFGGGARHKWNNVQHSVSNILNGNEEDGAPWGDVSGEHEEPQSEHAPTEEEIETGRPTQSVAGGKATGRWKAPKRIYDDKGKDITSEVESSVNGSNADDDGYLEEAEIRKAEKERREKERLKNNVEMTKKGMAKFRRNRHVVYDRNGAKPKTITTDDGHQVDLTFDKDREILSGNVVRGFIVKTPGDGTCGIHAVIQDLALYGFIDEDGRMAEYHRMIDATPSMAWHQQEELASYVNWLRMGLVIIGPEEGNIYKYGTKNSEHNVTILRQKGHFATFVPDDRGNVEFKGLKISDGELTPKESIAMAEEVLRGLDNQGLSEDIRARVREIREEESRRNSDDRNQGHTWGQWGGGRGRDSYGRGAYSRSRGGGRDSRGGGRWSNRGGRFS